MGKSKKEVKKDNKILYVICAVLIIIIISVIIFLLLNNRNVICENVSNQKADGYKIENTYNISSDKGIVNKVVIKEVITSEKKDVLNNYEKQLKDQYEYNKTIYGGYAYKINKSNGKLEADITVDYTKMNLERFIKDNEAMRQYTKDNKLTLDGARKLYESSGAKCR